MRTLLKKKPKKPEPPPKAKPKPKAKEKPMPDETNYEQQQSSGDDPRKQDQLDDPEHLTPHPRGEQSRPAEPRGAGSGEEAILYRERIPAPIYPLPRKEIVEELLHEAKAKEEADEAAYDASIGRMEERDETLKEAMERNHRTPDQMREDAKELNEAIYEEAKPENREKLAKAIQELRAKKYPQPNQGGAPGGNAHA
jgi:hypothetical protein